MPISRLSLYFVFAALAANLIGCLTYEAKEYTFKLNDGNSGSGKIKYINIMRSEDSTVTIESDYEELINTYLKGNKPEDELLGIKNVRKKLFEEDNQLCGEISFDFDDITTLKFFNYKNKVWAYNISSSGLGLFGGNESYFSSNGTFGGETTPVIFWDDNQKEFEFKTTVSQNDKKTTGLLSIWKQKGEQ
jgi:hypothetical protein